MYRDLLPLRSLVVSIVHHTVYEALTLRIHYSQKVFLTRPIPVEFFFIPITFGLGLLL